MHIKTIKKIQNGLKELQINNKFRKPYQLIIHPSFFKGKMRSYDIMNKLFVSFKLLVTECTYKHFKDTFITHCEIRNCKKGCRFFENKFGKKTNEPQNNTSNKESIPVVSETTAKTSVLIENEKDLNEEDINNAIHDCIKGILKKKNKFRYIMVCSDKEVINDLLKQPRVPILEVFGLNISLNLSNMNIKKIKIQNENIKQEDF